jgi:hypothetical protein
VLTRGGGRAGPLRRLLAVGASTVLLLAASAAGLADAAAADDPGANCPPGQTNCDVWDSKPGNPGKPGDPGGPGGGGGSGPDRKCKRDGVPVKCYDDVLGWFNSGDGCYYKLAEPQPTGMPAGKQMYLKSCAGAGVGSQVPVVLDAPPGGFGAPPDPAELAAQILASITLERPPVGIAPHSRTGAAGLVGLPVWLWTSDDQPYWGPIEKSDTDRGLTVTITAKVEKVVWDMGNGDKVDCDNPGVAHQNQPGRSPKCGYDGYRKSSGPAGYQVTATTHWRVHWTGGGESGDIFTTRTSPDVPIRITELQVVTR